jgi:photosystem II stability/assembly factor-like uncharacterized protein
VGSSQPHLNSDQLRQRDAWFYGIRAYPLANTPQGLRERALDKMHSMREQELVSDTVSAVSRPAWRQIGPQPYQDSLNYSGRANAIAVDPRNNGTVYLGTAGGGIWKSVDEGVHWFPISDHEPSLATGAIAIDPNQPATLYVGTGEANSSVDSYHGAGMIKSTDEGHTWRKLPFQFPSYGFGNVFGALTVDPANSSVVLAGHGTGIWRSSDAGEKWSQVLPGTTGYAVFFDRSHPNVAYAALGGIYGDISNGVYKSIDSGATWTRLTGTPKHPFPSADLGRINLIEDPSRSGTLYASVSNCCNPFSAPIGIFKSTDEGANWTKLANPGDCCDWYRNAIAVSPMNPNVLFAGGADLWRSLDGGKTWADIGGQGNGLHADQHDIVFTSAGKTIYVANDGGIFSSSTYQDANYSFKDLNASLATITFYPGLAVDQTNLHHTLAGAQDNGLELYAGKLAWKPSNAYYCGDGGEAAFDRQNSNYALSTCEGGSATLTRSTDGGRTYAGWQAAQNGINLNEPHGWVPPVAFDPENHFGYYGTDHIYQSQDYGADWAEISGRLTSGTISAITASPSDPQVVYVGGSDGSLQVTENSLESTGASWRLINAGLPTAYITSVTVDPGNPKGIWVTLGGSGAGHVFHSTTGGSSWTDVSSNLPDITVSRIVLDEDFPRWYVATDVGVFLTRNGGDSWQLYGTGLPDVVVQDIQIDEPARILVAVTHGRSAWTAALPYAALSLSPSSLNFGNEPVGHSSAARTVTIYNPGNAPLTITSINRTGSDASDFSDTTTCGPSLAGHKTCQIAVRFSPKAKGKLNGKLSIYDQSSRFPQVIYINGTGT